MSMVECWSALEFYLSSRCLQVGLVLRVPGFVGGDDEDYYDGPVRNGAHHRVPQHGTDRRFKTVSLTFGSHVQGGKQPVPERMALIQWLDSYDRVASCAFS